MDRYGAIIANWNGEHFLERCLASVLAAGRRAGVALEILVVDDASEDRSVELIEKQFHEVQVLRLPKNVGFGAAVNTAMQAAESHWIFLLNNDLALEPDFCARLIETLHVHQRGHEQVFAIGAQTLDWTTGEPNHNGQRAVWRGGMLVQQSFECEKAALTDFFQAGACLIDRRKFLELGGFAAVYYPAYWEDYDLAWQAQARGWVNLYEPRAVAHHCGKGSMRKRYGDYGVSLLIRRNHLLFIWCNVLEQAYLRRHLKGLGGLVWRNAAPGESGGRNPDRAQASWGRAVLAALWRLGPVLALRRSRARAAAARPEPLREMLRTADRRA